MKKILGYINPNVVFPAPLIIAAKKIVPHSNSLYLIYPNGESLVIDNYDKSFEDIPNYIHGQGKIIIDFSDKKYAYGISKDKILVETHGDMLQLLKEIIKNNEVMDDQCVIRLNKYIQYLERKYSRKKENCFVPMRHIERYIKNKEKSQVEKQSLTNFPNMDFKKLNITYSQENYFVECGRNEYTEHTI